MSNTPQAATPLYVRISDVKAMFGISVPTQYRMINDGKIEAVKVGRHTRIVLASVERYFANLPRLGKKAD